MPNGQQRPRELADHLVEEAAALKLEGRTHIIKAAERCESEGMNSRPISSILTSSLSCPSSGSSMRSALNSVLTGLRFRSAVLLN